MVSWKHEVIWRRCMSGPWYAKAWFRFGTRSVCPFIRQYPSLVSTPYLVGYAHATRILISRLIPALEEVASWDKAPLRTAHQQAVYTKAGPAGLPRSWWQSRHPRL